MLMESVVEMMIPQEELIVADIETDNIQEEMKEGQTFQIITHLQSVGITLLKDSTPKK